MRWMKEGSYTVEGTIIISFICCIVGLVILLGFYGHDRAVMQSIADTLAMESGLWSGRYLQAAIREVDYEPMKQNQQMSIADMETRGHRMLQGKLFCGTVKDIQVSKSLLGREVQVEILSDFKIFKWNIPCKVSAESIVFLSDDLPRRKGTEQGDNMNE